MDILVCIKQVPATSEVEVDEKTGVLRRDGTASKVNPYDLYALETALRLREERGGHVHALSMGPLQAKAALLEALCIGADAGTLLCDRRFAGADVLATARALSAAIRHIGRFDLILCGKQTTDGDTAQVGPEIAEMLGIEHASYVQSARVESGRVRARVQLGDIVQTLDLPLPCLLTVEKDICTPRLPSYLRSGQVKEDDIACLTLEDLRDIGEAEVGLKGSPTQVERIFPPEHNANRQLLRGDAARVARELYDILLERKFI